MNKFIKKIFLLLSILALSLISISNISPQTHAAQSTLYFTTAPPKVTQSDTSFDISLGDLIDGHYYMLLHDTSPSDYDISDSNNSTWANMVRGRQDTTIENGVWRHAEAHPAGGFFIFQAKRTGSWGVGSANNLTFTTIKHICTNFESKPLGENCSETFDTGAISLMLIDVTSNNPDDPTDLPTKDNLKDRDYFSGTLRIGSQTTAGEAKVILTQHRLGECPNQGDNGINSDCNLSVTIKNVNRHSVWAIEIYDSSGSQVENWTSDADGYHYNETVKTIINDPLEDHVFSPGNYFISVHSDKGGGYLLQNEKFTIIPDDQIKCDSNDPLDKENPNCANTQFLVNKIASETSTSPSVPVPCTGIDCNTAIGRISTDPASFITDIFKIALGIAGGVAFLLMVFGAFRLLTSGGNPDSLNAGRDLITSAVVGLLFITFSVLLLRIIGVDILHIPGFSGS